MSYYIKQQCPALSTSKNGEKILFQTFVFAQLTTHYVNADAHTSPAKASLTAAKKRSSATLLRQKLKGPLVRELRKI
jgi:hypothetical protein